MRNLIRTLVLAFLAGCSAESNNTPAPVVDTFDPTKATLLKTGVLMGVNHTASGTAAVYEQNGSYIVLLNPFNSQDGPDLKVYLSKDVSATSYLRLGMLKSTSGKQSYLVPAATDITVYHFVHIWCEKFTVEFARAEVK